MGGPLPMMRAAVAALLVAGAAAYSCPAHSYFSGGSWPPASFDSCTCFWGLVKHNGGCINPTAVPGYTNPCNITECPSGSFMNSWPVCNLDDCTCNYGYLENTAGGCDRNTFTCPANSYQYTSGSPTDTTGCRCNYGYQADNGAPPGHLFTSCVAVASATSGTTTSSTFSCPANSYQYAAGTATSNEHCRCNYGYSPEIPTNGVCVQNTGTRVSGVELAGTCNGFDGVYDYQGTAQSGAPYYANANLNMVLYYDPSCDGGTEPGRWILDPGAASSVNTGAANDLDGDGTCDYSGRFNEPDFGVLLGARTWRMW